MITIDENGEEKSSAEVEEVNSETVKSHSVFRVRTTSISHCFCCFLSVCFHAVPSGKSSSGPLN